MSNFSILIKFILILSLINSYLAELCSNIDENKYNIIEFNTPFQFDTKPGNEVCLKYNLKPNKNIIGLSFLKSNSYTVEVLIYDSYNKIIDDKSNYKSKVDSYIIGLQDFKEINVNNFENSVYLIIRESQSYYYSDYIKLYDSEVPFQLKENIPMNIKYFMSNKEYNFIFNSEQKVTISYSSKIKGLKTISISKDGNLADNKKDNKDILITYESSNLNAEYKINIKINSEQENKYDQEFSIIYYENFGNFKEINKFNREKINYLSNDNQIQIFYFYININQYFNGSYTINFKLDYNAKINKYIEIISNQVPTLPDLNNYEFKKNELQSAYDRDSDEYFTYYFKPENPTYILIKVQINEINNYRIPNYFYISYSGPVIDYKILSGINEIPKPEYVPYYINLRSENSENYLFYAPYEDYCTLLKGDIFENNIINKNFIDEPSDLHEINNNNRNITAILSSSTKSVKFIFQKYEPNDVLILNLNDRIKAPFNKTFTNEECNGNKKYIILKYNILFYSIGQNKFENYWTTDGDMDVYYNNSLNSNDFFPNEENKMEKEILYKSSTHLDLFTIKCNKPGTFYIRPLKKIFKETTHDVSQNSINQFEIFLGTEIIQLFSPIKDASPHIYLSILTLSENEIKISPDTPGLFKETTIDSKSKYFSLEIDTKKYKMDQMAIKLTSNSNNNVEVIEATDCPYCIYQEISNEKSEKNLEINKNNFVIFMGEKVTSFSIIINNLEDEEVAYGIVDLPSNNIKYIPLAYSFKTIKREKLDEIFNVTIEVESKKDQFKPYKAFVFSLISDKLINYNVDLKFRYKSNEKLFGIILIISLGVAFIISFAITLYFVLKRKRKRLVIEDLDDNYDKLIP